MIKQVAVKRESSEKERSLDGCKPLFHLACVSALAANQPFIKNHQLTGICHEKLRVVRVVST